MTKCVEIYNSIISNLIFTEIYDENTSINKIKRDFERNTYYKFTKYDFIYQINVLKDDIRLFNISNENIIKIFVVQIEEKNINTIFNKIIINYFANGFIILNIGWSDYYIHDFRNNIYLDIYKIIPVYVVTNTNMCYILTIDNKLYVLQRKKKMKYKIKYIDDNINNIYYSNYYLIIEKNNEIIIISIVDINFMKTININTNNIKNINICNKICYIEKYDDSIYIFYDIRSDTELNLNYTNVKKILFTIRDCIVFTDNQLKLVMSRDNSIIKEYKKIFDNIKYIDIISDNEKIYCGILENKDIIIFGENSKLYDNNLINNFIKKHLINIYKILILSESIIIISNDNRIVVCKSDNQLFILDNNKEILDNYYSIGIITNDNKMKILTGIEEDYFELEIFTDYGDNIEYKLYQYTPNYYFILTENNILKHYYIKHYGPNNSPYEEPNFHEHKLNITFKKIISFNSRLIIFITEDNILSASLFNNCYYDSDYNEIIDIYKKYQIYKIDFL
jgi:hypothetical protein